MYHIPLTYLAVVPEVIAVIKTSGVVTNGVLNIVISVEGVKLVQI